jgi:phosphoglycolate phosphatase-like HAD superfamily hydrolase
VRAAIRRAERLASVDQFEACIAVGDAIWDLSAAAELGLPFIGVARGEQASRLREAGARTIFEDLSDADRFLATVGTLAGRGSTP